MEKHLSRIKLGIYSYCMKLNFVNIRLRTQMNLKYNVELCMNIVFM